MWQFFSLLTLLFASVAHAATPAEFTLTNGMQVVVIEDPRIPAVSHNLLFRIGAADDPRGESGLAHYLEHMLFQGTKKYRPNEYSHLIAHKGGQHNAFTTSDYTGYWVNIAREQLAMVMRLEADRLQHLQPTPSNFNREKQVILEERRMRVDNDPAALFAEQMDALLYYHHPYGTPIIGWAQEMEQLNRETVMRYYQDYYHPGNAVLVVSGDVKVAEVRKLAEQIYGAIPARKGHPAPRVQEPPQLGARRFTMHHPQVKQADWQKSYVTASYGYLSHRERSKSAQTISGEGEKTATPSPGSPHGIWHSPTSPNGRGNNAASLLPLLAAEHLLGGSKLSRLHQRLVEQDGLATEAAVSFNPFRQGPGQFDIYVTPRDTQHLPAIEKAVTEELQKLKQTTPSAAELARAKTQMIASNVYLRDGLQSLAQVMGHLKMIGLPLDYYTRWEERVNAITAEEISASLALLNEEYSVTGELLPQ